MPLITPGDVNVHGMAANFTIRDESKISSLVSFKKHRLTFKAKRASYADLLL